MPTISTTTSRTEVVRQGSVLLENSSKERHGDQGGNISSLHQREDPVTGDVDQLGAESNAVKEDLREYPGTLTEGPGEPQTGEGGVGGGEELVVLHLVLAAGLCRVGGVALHDGAHLHPEVSGHAPVLIVVSSEGSQREDCGVGHLGRELRQATEPALVNTTLGSLTGGQEGNEGDKVVVNHLLELPGRRRDGAHRGLGVLGPVSLHLAGLHVEVGHQQGPARGLRDVVVVGEVAATGVDPTPGPPASSAVSVGAQEVDLQSSGPGILVRVSQLVGELQLASGQNYHKCVLKALSGKSD